MSKWQKFWHAIYYGITVIGGILIAMYFTLLVLPVSFFVKVYEFSVDDISVGDRAVFVTTRDVRRTVGGNAIEEVNIENPEWEIEETYTYRRSALAEGWLRTVSRTVDYIHQNKWEYELILHITYDLPFGIKKILILSDTYTVN